MTDNGPQQPRYNAGMRGLKGSVYEGGIRVPCFVRWPGVIRAGTKVDRVGASIDIFPTLLEACSLQSPADVKIDGRSLFSLLRSPAPIPPWQDRSLFFQWHRGDRAEPFRNAAVRTQRYKLLDGKELYDVETDPGEKADIAAANPSIVARLRADYEGWFADVSATRNYAPPRIFIGTEHENPVLLTRQDWRGPRAGWAPESLGHWEVDIRAAGEYECTLLFPATQSEGSAVLSLAGLEISVPISKGATEAVLRLTKLPSGPSRLEAELRTTGDAVGPHYVSVRKLP
jgi:hypothetical protein